MLKLASFSLFLIFAGGVALGDANEGVLFGYKLGDRYRANEQTQRLLSGTIVAQTTDLPADLDQLLLKVTPKTYTITSIHGVARFDDIEYALKLKSRYRKLLVAEYSDWPSLIPYELAPLQLLSQSHMLSVKILRTRTVGLFELQVSLEHILGSRERADMDALRKAEVRELIRQASAAKAK